MLKFQLMSFLKRPQPSVCPAAAAPENVTQPARLSKALRVSHNNTTESQHTTTQHTPPLGLGVVKTCDTFLFRLDHKKMGHTHRSKSHTADGTARHTQQVWVQQEACTFTDLIGTLQNGGTAMQPAALTNTHNNTHTNKGRSCSAARTATHTTNQTRRSTQIQTGKGQGQQHTHTHTHTHTQTHDKTGLVRESNEGRAVSGQSAIEHTTLNALHSQQASQRRSVVQIITK